MVEFVVAFCEEKNLSVLKQTKKVRSTANNQWNFSWWHSSLKSVRREDSSGKHAMTHPESLQLLIISSHTPAKIKLG